MKYSFLGNTGLLVSKLSIGSWVTFGSQLNVDKSYEILVHAYKAGVNFFDNAEAYGLGQAEILMGKNVKKGIEDGIWERSDLVISTKIFHGYKEKPGPNDKGLSRKHVIEGTKASLKRLDMEYVDLIFCHRPDPCTPLEEVVRGMNYVIEKGWALYWGTSEWNATDIFEACNIADRLGLIRPAFDQPQYHIFDRSRVDYDMVHLYKKYGYGLTTWSPLASGILTGKYSKGIPEGTRLAMPKVREHVTTNLMTDFEGKIKQADKLIPIAAKVGCSLAQMAIAWAAKNPHVSTVILGASSIAQLDENLKALEFVDRLSPEILHEIDQVADFKPRVCNTTEPRLIKARMQWL